MNPMTPTELYSAWEPKLRSIAFATGCDVDGVRQEAWVLAATLFRLGADDIALRWLKAVLRHAPYQALRSQVAEGDFEMVGGDDPREILEVVESVEMHLASESLEIENAVGMSNCPRELAKVLRITDRHARRIWAMAKKRGGQGDMFGGLPA